jgi:long-chain acyl-CoA synthetase
MDFNLAVMVAESARRTPGKPAVILGETKISYAQLDAQSDRVAASLTAAGVGVGDRVGLQLPNIPQFVIAYFGILKAGGVVVPMNVLLKAPEIEFQLRDSGAGTLITFGGCLDEAAKAAASADVASLYVAAATTPLVAGVPFDTLLAGGQPGRSWPCAARPTLRSSSTPRGRRESRRVPCCPTSRCT